MSISQTLTDMRKKEQQFRKRVSKYEGYTDAGVVNEMVSEADEALRTAIGEQQRDRAEQANLWDIWFVDTFARAIPTAEETTNVPLPKRNTARVKMRQDLNRIELLYRRLEQNLPIASARGAAFLTEWRRVLDQVYDDNAPSVPQELDVQFYEAFSLLGVEYDKWEDNLETDKDALKKKDGRSKVRDEFLLPTLLLEYSDRLKAVREVIIKPLPKGPRENPPPGLSTLIAPL